MTTFTNIKEIYSLNSNQCSWNIISLKNDLYMLDGQNTKVSHLYRPLIDLRQVITELTPSVDACTIKSLLYRATEYKVHK